MRGETLAKILRSLASAVENLDETQIEAFAASLKRNSFVGVHNNKSEIKNRHQKVDPIALQGVLQKLNATSTREDGAQLLDRLELSRKELESLARLRNVHVTKDDNILKIKEKLVESIIGARLNSRAIRGM